jgi:hypothetical protein
MGKLPPFYTFRSLVGVCFDKNLLDINVKKRRMGYLETYMRLPALLDSPDTL